jgi:hypothetical protein
VAEKKIKIIVAIKWQHKLQHGTTIVAIRHSVKKTRQFNLCVCDVTIIFFVGGLGIEDQQNGLREFPIYTTFCGAARHSKSNDRNKEHSMNGDNKSEIFLSMFLGTLWVTLGL